jgi:prepilin-type N-terminal cleavage/methylation domain-containing protein/prepilin-type processing-associated H-X9-DG protein
MEMRAGRRRAFTLVELAISLAVVGVLLVILVPALSSARAASRRAYCAGNLRLLGTAWANFVEASERRFPILYTQPSWSWGGVRFSPVDGSPFLDLDRPVNRFLPFQRVGAGGESLFRCPCDEGITDESGMRGTGQRSAFVAYGTSYRANSRLTMPRGGDLGLARDEVTTAPSRLLVLGDPFWFEVWEGTGLSAAWHGASNAGNILFLDGSVRFVTIQHKSRPGPIVLDPRLIP